MTDGSVHVITGATSGIGEATAIELARRGAHVALVCRSLERGEATRARIRSETGSDAVSLHCADLAAFSDVRRVAGEILDAFPRIDVLVNNAAVIHMRPERTVDGFEAMFAVNHLAPFLLTNLLLDRIRATPGARIVNVSSNAHRYARLDLDDPNSERDFAWMRTYGRSKGANILFTRELARRLEGTGVTANSLHPGAVTTGLGANNAPRLHRVLNGILRPFFLSPEGGARTSVLLATSPELAGVSGGFFVKGRQRTPAAWTLDDEFARCLWEASERWVGLA